MPFPYLLLLPLVPIPPPPVCACSALLFSDFVNEKMTFLFKRIFEPVEATIKMGLI
jgi:hypothetical protein